MAAVKDTTLVMNGQNLTGGGGDVFSGYQDLRTAYGAIWFIEVENDVQKQEQGVVVQAQLAPDQVAGNDFDFDCRKVAVQAASTKSKFIIRIPPEAPFTRLKVTPGNEDATITARLTVLTQV